STDKVDTEVPSPVAGAQLEIDVQEDDTDEVGAEPAYVGSGEPGGAEPEPEHEADPEAEAEKEPEPEPEPEPAHEKQPEPEPEPAKAEEPAKGEAPAQQPESAAASAEAGAYVTPLVRKLAADKGVDLASITGSGVGGRIRK